MASLVKSSNLEVAAILAQTHRKYSVINDPLLLHHVVYGLKSVYIHGRTLGTKADDSIGFLLIEVLGLSLDASKCVLKHVNPCARVLTKVKRVLCDKAFISAPFGIALIKTAAIVRRARAVDFLAAEKFETIAEAALVKLVDMLATFATGAQFLAWDGSDTRSSIND